jgi:hypothetical protein
MQTRSFRTAKPAVTKTIRRLLAVVVAGAMLLGLCACAGQKTAGIEPVTVEREPEPQTVQTAAIEPVTVEREPGPQTLQTANAATALALRYYVYARLETEALMAADFPGLEEFESQLDELALIWETAEALASGAEEITGLALVLLQAAAADHQAAFVQRVVFVQPLPQAMPLAAERSVSAAVPLAAHGGREIDPETWAENLSKQYDALRGAQRYKQLAQQLGTDTKTAVEQMALAQKIIRNAADLEEAQAEVGAFTRSINIVQGYKTASKVGLFVGAAVATGGGSLTSLAGSSMTLGKAGAVMVGGVDCIVDVGATTSSIVLGENHQVTVDFQQAGDVLQPLSMVLGLVTMNPNDTGDQIALIGESLMEWFYPGKITAIGVEKLKSKGTKMIAQIVNSAAEDLPGVRKALELMGLTLPTEEGVSPSKLKLEYTVNSETALANMHELAVQIAAQNWEEEPASPPQTDPGGQPGVPNISGLYQGTATVTAAKNDSLGTVTEMSFRVRQNNDGTASLLADGEVVAAGSYNQETGAFALDHGFLWHLTFASEGDTITAKGSMTSDETGEGFTQEVILDLKRIGD